MSDKHKRFQALLGASEDSVWKVMRWLSEKGYTVRKEPISIAPTVRDKDSHKDDGDFDVIINGKRHPIEVKHLRAQFTGPVDWPHRGKFIVDSVTTLDGKRRVPFFYIYLSKDEKHMAMLDVEASRPHWYKEMKWCGNYKDVGGLESEFYMINTKHVTSWHRGCS